jgi:hypothetical protein
VKSPGKIRIGQMNLNKIKRAKFDRLLPILDDFDTDVFVGTVTHLDRATASHYLMNNPVWTVFRADFENVEDDPSEGAKRGGVMVMVRAKLCIESVKVAPIHGIMSVLSVILNRKDWDRHVRSNGIYRSPSSSPEEASQQFAKIKELLTENGGPGKPTIHIMAGDFNAHTGTASEGSHLHTVRPSPPPRWGDPSPNHQPRRGAGSSPGDLLLDVLEETNGIGYSRCFQRVSSLSRTSIASMLHVTLHMC